MTVCRWRVWAPVTGLAALLARPVEGAPLNDNFAARQVITGFPAVVTGSNVGATKEPGEPHHAGNSGGKSVWWTWTAPVSSVVEVATAGSSFDTLLGVYTGSAVSNLTLVANDNDSGSDGSSKLTFMATAGLAYQIAVDGYGYDPGGGYQVFTGNIVLAITNAPPGPLPQVSVTKLSYSPLLIAPTNLVLTATASSANTNVTITQVRYFEGSNLVGQATSSPYSVTWSNVPAGIHRVTAWAADSAGLTNASLPVTITVTPPPRLELLGVTHAGTQLQLQAQGSVYYVQISTNLADWDALTVVSNVDPVAEVIDPTSAARSQGFYRAYAVPFDLSRIRGWLHTTNRQIVDASGEAVHLHGINSSGMEYGVGRPYSAGDGGYAPPPASEYDTLARWGFNVVRLPIAWANIETNPPTTNALGAVIHTYNEPYLALVDQIIEQFGARQIAVILSMHQWGWSPVYQLPRADGRIIHGFGLPAWLYPDTNAVDATQARIQFFTNRNDVQAGFIAAWTNVARRYVTNSTLIGADLFNEPSTIADYSNTTPPATNRLDDFYQRLGRAILDVNPNLVLLFQQGPGTPVTRPPPFTNQVVYSFHNYPRNWPYDGLIWARDYWKRATNWNIPLWLGEFQSIGHLTVTTGPTAWPTQTADMLDWCNQRDIGWASWAYQRAFRPLNGDGGTGPTDWDLLRLLQGEFP